MTVLVAGATGTTGSALLDALVAADVPVRALTRSAGNVAGLQRPGVDAVAAHYDDPATLGQAFTGVTAAYIVSPSSPEMTDVEGELARAAVDAGAHVVKLSVIGATLDSPLRLARMHAASEAAIEALGGTWTFLQPNGFMQNDLAWAAQIPSGTIAAPVADAAWSIVDVRDIAQVAVAALTDPTAHAGRRIAITGPEARTPRDRIAALATILRRELAVHDAPLAAVEEQLRGAGMSEWHVAGLLELFDLYARGDAAGVAPDAEPILGRPHDAGRTSPSTTLGPSGTDTTGDLRGAALAGSSATACSPRTRLCALGSRGAPARAAPAALVDVVRSTRPTTASRPSPTRCHSTPRHRRRAARPAPPLHAGDPRRHGTAPRRRPVAWPRRRTSRASAWWRNRRPEPAAPWRPRVTTTGHSRPRTSKRTAATISSMLAP